MGADCGTAIIDGVALGFANAVGRGPVGIVGASGTGIQEVSCLLDAAGIGVSHAIGVGGRDLSARVGGLMMRRGLELLAGDDGHARDRRDLQAAGRRRGRAIEDVAAGAGKPVVLGLSDDVTLEQAARARGRARGRRAAGVRRPARPPARPGARPRPVQRRDALRARRRGSSARGEFTDFGADEYTQGRAHPMIDPSLRIERLAAAARDPGVSVLLLDVVLGYGAHPDPAASWRR